MGHRRRVAGRLALGSASLIALALSSTLGGCLNRPVQPLDPRTTSVVVEQIPSPIDKIDILLDIDNSSSMADKQAILAEAVPDLVKRLVNPYCVDANGVADAVQPQNPGDACTGSKSVREFNPIADINIGIVDSSLGGFGSDECPVGPGTRNDDQGHLVARSADNTPTYMNQGFLAWDFNHVRGGISDFAELKTALKSLVAGVGQDGCGYENQFEAAVRFLVDPNPYQTTVTGGDGMSISRMGTDQTILTQRAQFLRPDSLLVVVALSDEDEHSMNTLAPLDYRPINSGGYHRATSVCATNPGDPCCTSCMSPTPSGCPSVASDPSCTTNGGSYLKIEDPYLLKQDRMKQQYGFEGRFPVKRYVNAFTQLTIDPSKPDLGVDANNPKSGVTNPIFANLAGKKAGRVRTPDMVYFAAITGVPYEDIAVDPKNIAKGFKDYKALTADGFWAKDVGDPDHYVAPTNPIMQETGQKRPGVGAGAPNGGDRSLDPTHPPDFQYACVFKLPVPEPTGISCQANVLANDAPDNPLCTLSGGTASEPQLAAKAYPGLRELAVAQGMQGQGIVASICPANADNEADQGTYGYNPAVLSIVDRLKQSLGQQCLPRQLHPGADGGVPCVVIEAQHSDSGQSECNTPGRARVPRENLGAIDAAKLDQGAGLDWNDFCLITELEGSAGATCQNTLDADLPSTGLDGWCYVDATTVPPTGNPDIVKGCPANAPHTIRFVGKGEVQRGATAIVSCYVDSDH